MISLHSRVDPEIQSILWRAAAVIVAMVIIARLFVLFSVQFIASPIPISLAIVAAFFGYNVYRSRDLLRSRLFQLNKLALTTVTALGGLGIYCGGLQAQEFLGQRYRFDPSLLSHSTEVLSAALGFAWSLLFVWLVIGVAASVLWLLQKAHRFPLVKQSAVYTGLNKTEKADEISARAAEHDRIYSPYLSLCVALWIGVGALAVLTADISETIISPDTSYGKQINRIVSQLDFKPYSKCQNVRPGDRSLRIDEETIRVARAETPWRFDEEPCELKRSDAPVNSTVVGDPQPKKRFTHRTKSPPSRNTNTRHMLSSTVGQEGALSVLETLPGSSGLTIACCSPNFPNSH